MEKTPPLPVTAPSADLLDNARQSRPAQSVDYLIRQGGQIYAGAHLLIDFWGSSGLNDIDFIESALRDAAGAANAALLHLHLHEFGGEGGVSGVALLAESHISVHTWPELDYAAFDVFMCGNCRPDLALRILEERFNPKRKSVKESRRGVVE